MAFPTVESVTETSFPTNGTSHALDYPASTSAGELLALIFANENNTNHSIPSGYTQLDQQTFGNQVRTGIYAKVADGAEGGGTVTISTSAAEAGSGQIYRISGWGGTIATDIDISTVATGSGSAPTPNGVTAGWGSDDNLFIAVLGAGDDDESADSGPTNFTNLTDTACGAGQNDSARVITARRAIASAEQSPGNFSLTGSERFTTWTMVIKPSTGTGATLTDTFTLTWTLAPTWTASLVAASADGLLGPEMGLFSFSGVGQSVHPPTNIPVVTMGRRTTMQSTEIFFITDISDNMGGSVSLKDRFAAKTRTPGV